MDVYETQQMTKDYSLIITYFKTDTPKYLHKNGVNIISLYNII